MQITICCVFFSFKILSVVSFGFLPDPWVLQKCVISLQVLEAFAIFLLLISNSDIVREYFETCPWLLMEAVWGLSLSPGLVQPCLLLYLSGFSFICFILIPFPLFFLLTPFLLLSPHVPVTARVPVKGDGVTMVAFGRLWLNPCPGGVALLPWDIWPCGKPLSKSWVWF